MNNTNSSRQFQERRTGGEAPPTNVISSLRALLLAQSGAKGKALLLTGAIMHPVQTRRWLRFLAEDRLFWSLARAHPHWSVKIYRPYLSSRMGCRDRVDVLTQHYGMVRDVGLAPGVWQMAEHAKTVSTFSGKSGTVFRLELSNYHLSGREGELYLQLVSNGVFLYRTVFSFFTQNGEVFVKIGCVQGLRAEDGADSIRSTTRELYGCRPKNLLVSVVRDMGAYFGCKGMIGVGNGNRIVAHGGRHRTTAPDYDQTWEEMSAEKRSDGNFELPCTNILKTSFDEIPSKKRSEAKKKNALLASIFESVRASLNKERFVEKRRA